MAVLIDRRADIDKLIASGFYNGMFSHPLESLREFSFSPNSHSAADDFTGFIWFNWVRITFNLKDDAALDEVTHGVVIRRKVIEVPSFGRGFFWGGN